MKKPFKRITFKLASTSENMAKLQGFADKGQGQRANIHQLGLMGMAAQQANQQFGVHAIAGKAHGDLLLRTDIAKTVGKSGVAIALSMTPQAPSNLASGVPSLGYPEGGKKRQRMGHTGK